LVLVNSYYTAQEVRAFSDKAVEVLYPPFSSTISAIGRETSKTSQEKLVVTTSRLEPNKLLERIPYIAAQTQKDTQFAVIGRLCNKQTLSNLQLLIKKLDLADRVKLYPDASAEQKIGLLRKAKVYLHTMVGEHFGISIVEAMALGCVPIAHDSGVMKEFVPTQYRYDTLQKAANKIDYVMDNWSPDTSEEMKRIADQFSISNFSQRFMAFFDKYN
jgi:glycosyltransferase involved in cell wall biosynthesis